MRFYLESSEFLSWSFIVFHMDFGDKGISNVVDVSAFRYVLPYEFIRVFDGTFFCNEAYESVK